MSFASGQNATAASLNAASGVQTAGGILRVTNSASTSGTTELAWATTGSLALAANTLYEVEAECYLLNSGSAVDLYILRIRDTNVSGTIRQAIDAYPTTTSGTGPYPVRCTYTFATSSAVNYVACATIVRASGAETCQVVAGSKLVVTALGPSTVLATV